MDTAKFQELVSGLADEHVRLTAVIEELIAENGRLKQARTTNSCFNSMARHVGCVHAGRSRNKETADTPNGRKVDEGTNRLPNSEPICENASQVADDELTRDTPRSRHVGFEQPISTSDVSIDVDESAVPNMDNTPSSPVDGLDSAAAVRRVATRRSAKKRLASGASRLDAAFIRLDSAGAPSSVLPDTWSEWVMPVSDAVQELTARSSVEGNKRSVLGLKPSMKSGSRIQAHGGWANRFILHPGSNFRLLWDVCSVLVMATDVLIIPLDIAGFDLFHDSLDSAVNILTASFWSLDIVMSFVTGFPLQGLVIMGPGAIAWNYLRSWFAFDLWLVMMDWIFYFFSVYSVLRIAKFKRFARLLRALRLVRSLKMHGKLVQLMEALKSESLIAVMNIITLAVCILVTNHYFACGWYAVGASSDGEDSWVYQTVRDESEIFKYATSLHWSLTQFTPAAMEIHPYNLSERAYSIVILFIAMITFSTFTGSITANMTTLRKIKSEPAKNQKILNDYFVEYGISADLGHRIWEYLAANHFAYKKKVVRANIAVLKLLPPSIISKLNEELYVPVVQKCPFFYLFGVLSYAGLCLVCDSILSENSFTLGEDVFTSGLMANKMYFVITGNLVYRKKAALVGEALEHLSDGDRICEPALFMKWTHRGRLSADTSVQMLEASVAKFRAVVGVQPRVLPYVRRYVQKLREFMLCEPLWKQDVWMQDELLEIAMCASNCSGPRWSEMCDDATE